MIWKFGGKIIQQLLLIFYILKKKKVCPAYISKINWDYKNHVILLIIINEEEKRWNYLAVKKLSTLLHGIT